MEQEKQNNAQHFLDLIQKSRKGKFKVYIGMSAGVGKTFRMLQEAHTLLKNGIDVKIGYIETHNRKETTRRNGCAGDYQLASRSGDCR
jgi:two-component system sensor histidine kinase KdpD